MSQTKGLVFADFAWKDTTRFKTFLEISKENGRQLCIPFKDAYYIREMSKFIAGLPNLKELLIYQEKKGTGTYEERDYQKWEKMNLKASKGRRRKDSKE